MPNMNRADAIRGYFAAYKSGDRKHLEQVLAEDFTFTSHYDDRIDKATYFERCWPNKDLIRQHVIERIFAQGDEAFVLYRCMTRDGKEFRNTEFLHLQRRPAERGPGLFRRRLQGRPIRQASILVPAPTRGDQHD